jgi:hypothetical protein
MEGRLR